MPHRNWAERVDDELARRGVPARFRRRLLAELRDHADDLTDEEGTTMLSEEAMSTRLGDPAALAAHAAEEYRRARWVSRHPLLVFGVLPVPATLLAFSITVLLFVLSVAGYGCLVAGDPENLSRPTMVALAYSLAWSVRFVPFVILSVLFTRLYLRSRVNRWWLVAAGVQILVMAGSFAATIHYSPEPGKSSLSFGFGLIPYRTVEGWWTLPFLHYIGWMQAVQMVIPATVAAIIFRTARRNQAAFAVG